MTRRQCALLVLSLLVSLSCDGSKLAGPGDGRPSGGAVPASLRLLSGDAQRDTIGATLAAPFVVRIADAGGNAVAGVHVRWTTAAGMVAGDAVTDAQGQASARWVLGTIAGAQQLTINAGAFAALLVNVTALPGAPVQVRLLPKAATLVSLGDSLSLTATATDRAGNALAVPASAFGTLDSSVVVLGRAPIAIARANGTTRVIASMGPGAADTATLIVAQRPVRVTLSPGGASLFVGDTVKYAASVFDARGTVVTDATITWSSTDPGVVDATPNDGLLIARAPGSASVVATVGGASSTVGIAVRPRPVSQVAVSAPTSAVASGAASALVATLTDSRGQVLTGRTITWTSSDVTRATVDANGIVTAKLVGVVTVTATSEGIAGTVSISVTPGAVAALRLVSGDAQSGTVGAALSSPLVVRATDAAGNVVPDVAVAWTASGGGHLNAVATTTAADGTVRATWTLDSLSGANTASATGTGNLSAAFRATGMVGALTQVMVSPRTRTLTAIGQTGVLTARPADKYGNAIGTAVTWASSTPGVATVSTSGTVTAASPGAATITATAGGKTGTASIVVDLGSTLWVSSVSPDTLRPGATLTISGINFSSTSSGNTVTIAGVPGTVTAATSSQLSVALPGAAQFPCLATGPVTVTVTVNTQTISKSGILTGVGVRRSLAKGQSLIVSDPAELRCTELPVTGGRYFLSVYNSASVPSATAAFTMRGIGGTVSPLPTMAGLNRTPSLTGLNATNRTAPLAAGARTTTGSDNMGDGDAVAASRALIQRLGDPRAAWRAARASARAGSGASFSVAAAPITVGSTRTFNVPYKYGCMAAGPSVAARAVYVGAKIVIYEDQAAPLAGTVDTVLTRVGREYDQRQEGILTTNFGNPLGFDAQLDNNGVVQALFTPQVNALGLLGFVWSGDFYPLTTCPTSNGGETLYMYTPTAGSFGYWRNGVGSTLVHEAKHETAYAEAFANGYAFQESWLEEATAQVASELWGRAQGGFAQRGNVTYAQSLLCEQREACPGRTDGALPPWQWLNQYYFAFESHGLMDGDSYAKYGADWLLVRWAADHSGVPEAQFFKSLIATNLYGVENLEQRSGMSWRTMMGEFTLAMLADDYPNFTPANPHLSHPSWNTRDVAPNLWGGGTIFPLQKRTQSFGAFSADFAAMQGGAAALFDLSGAQTAAQAIELSATGGLPSDLRLALVRVE